MSDIIKAPWNEDQVLSLNAYQAKCMWHPYTCGNDNCRYGLTATPDGWECWMCGYTQNWCYAFTANWQWLSQHPVVLEWLCSYEETIEALKDQIKELRSQIEG